MTATTPSTTGAPRRRKPLALAAAMAVAGFATTAGAAFGGLVEITHYVGCKVVRDCVYADAPRTKLTGTPPAFTSDRTPVFRFTSNNGNAKFRCRVDAEPFKPCRSPHVTERLGNGPHGFEVYAITRSGKRDLTPAGHAFVVDTHAPDTAILDGPDRTRDRTPTFVLGSTEAPAKFQYKVDGKGRWARTGESLTLSKLNKGSHVLKARAFDRAGNVDGSPAKHEFRVTRGAGGG